MFLSLPSHTQLTPAVPRSFSPFQFPCLVQVLKGKRKDFMERRQNLLPKLINCCWIPEHTSNWQPRDLCIHCTPFFLSGETPTQPSRPRLNVPFVLEAGPVVLKVEFSFFPSFPRLGSYSFLLLYCFAPLYIIMTSLHACLPTMAWAPQRQGLCLSILCILPLQSLRHIVGLKTPGM